MKKIGFIGLGIMGASMAGHLIDAGYELSVYNRTKSKAEPLTARGARYCESPGACAAGQDAVITIVGYPKDVEEIYLGANGILANLSAGTYTADMTTSSPSLAVRIYEEAKKRSIHALDAPVTGGDMGARKATLNILVGGISCYAARLCRNGQEYRLRRRCRRRTKNQGGKSNCHRGSTGGRL